MLDSGDLVARMAPGGGGAWARGECALVWVEGPEAEGFLQGVLTCDVAALTPGAATPGLLLDVKGRIRADLRVVRDGPEAFTLITSPWLGDDLAEALRTAMVSEDAEVLGPESSVVVTVLGVDAAPIAPAELITPGRIPGSWDLLTGSPEEIGPPRPARGLQLAGRGRPHRRRSRSGGAGHHAWAHPGARGRP